MISFIITLNSRGQRYKSVDCGLSSILGSDHWFSCRKPPLKSPGWMLFRRNKPLQKKFTRCYPFDHVVSIDPQHPANSDRSATDSEFPAVSFKRSRPFFQLSTLTRVVLFLIPDHLLSFSGSSAIKRTHTHTQTHTRRHRVQSSRAERWRKDKQESIERWHNRGNGRQTWI